MSVTLTETKSGSDINATISGVIVEVDEAVKAYFDVFNPCGYQTHIEYEKIVDGIKTVYISRWNNCD
jgi:hypothetical protein